MTMTDEGCSWWWWLVKAGNRWWWLVMAVTLTMRNRTRVWHKLLTARPRAKVEVYTCMRKTTSTSEVYYNRLTIHWYAATNIYLVVFWSLPGVELCARWITTRGVFMQHNSPFERRSMSCNSSGKVLNIWRRVEIDCSL